MENESKLPEGGFLQATAKALGSAAGSLTAMASSVLPHEKVSVPVPIKASGRLARKNKARLPRKEKKALAKKRILAA